MTITEIARPRDTDTPAEPSVEAPLPEPTVADLIEEEMLVEEISIDGMCGVY